MPLRARLLFPGGFVFQRSLGRRQTAQVAIFREQALNLEVKNSNQAAAARQHRPTIAGQRGGIVAGRL
jgi:hypothetical protein